MVTPPAATPECNNPVGSRADPQIVVNVKEHGAVGDGIADDTDAIRSAIAAAASTGAVLLFPPGVFNVPTTGFTFPPHMHIRGTARGTSIVRYGGTGALFSLADSLKWYDGKQETVIEYLTLQGPYYGTNRNPDGPSVAIESAGDADDRGAAHATIRQVDIDGFGRGISGMFLGGLITESYITRCGTGIYLSQHSNATVVSKVTIYWANIGIESRGATNVVDECNIENNNVGWAAFPSYGIKVNGGSLVVSSSHLEEWQEGISHTGGILMTRSNFIGGCAYGLRMWPSVYADSSTPWRLLSNHDQIRRSAVADVAQDDGATAPLHLIAPILDPVGAAGVSLDAANTNNSWQDYGFVAPGMGGLRLRVGSISIDAGAMFAAGGISPGTPPGALQPGKLWMGSGVPASDGGEEGDFYFRTDTPRAENQRLYVKSAGTWMGIL